MRINKPARRNAGKLALAFGAVAVIGTSFITAQGELTQPGKSEMRVARAEGATSSSFPRLKKFNRDEKEKPQKKEEPQSEALKNLTLLYNLYRSLSQSPIFSGLRM